MRVMSLGIAAVAFGGLVLGTSAHASETVMLGGAGSLSGLRTDAAPVITLKSDATTAADTIEVYHPIARGIGGVARVGGRVAVGAGRVAVGGARFAAYRPWGGYRPWFGYGRYGYGRLWGGWFGYGRPWGGWYGYGRPWGGFYRPYLGWYGPGASYYGGDSCSCYPVASAVTYSAPVIINGYPSQPPQAGEMAPAPRPSEGYRYDGGPVRPVPTPKQTTPQTPPVPTPPGTVDTVARRATKKIEYPAYGETPGKARPARDPLLVKNTQG